ncbi:MAG: BrnT family toxin [Pseudobdellovibrionaceae bacterium]|nr:BrnT family toxin [Bdellovibrionales bacterium]USN46492.1 MAG: BrnT family toxin [Pseudobdellovibrionaceae bacterium]
MARWDFVDWLLYWILETSYFEFEWDSGNRSKNKTKHNISIDEVESVFRSGLALPLGIQISPVVSEQRLGLVGPTLNGKILQVAFTMREGRVRVISARPAHKKERNQYEEILRKIQKGV